MSPSRPPAEDLDPKRVLIINVFGIGDVLFTFPLIHNLKLHDPAIRVGYMCNERTDSLVTANPDVDAVYVYNRDDFARTAERSRLAHLRKVWSFARSIRSERYDTIFDFSMSSVFGFIGMIACRGRRIGYDFKNRGRFLSDRFPLGAEGFAEKPMVEYYLDLLRHYGLPADYVRYEMSRSREDEVWAHTFLRESGVKSETGPVIGLVPGGGSSWGDDAVYKRWPASGFAKLADKLIENLSAQIILLGDNAEESLCQTVLREMSGSAVSAVGQTSITQFGALAGVCGTLVCNDGGPLHMAVASGARVVGIFGPVDPRVYGPYPPEGHRVLKPAMDVPAYRGFRLDREKLPNLLDHISVEDVYQKVQELL